MKILIEHLKNAGSLAMIGFALVAIILLFSGNCSKVEKPVIIPVKTQVEVVKKKESIITAKVDSTQLIMQKLQSEKSKLLQSLKYYQSENKRLGGLALQIDTIYQPQEITDLVYNTVIADSICNEVVSNLEITVNKQAEIITLKDSMYVTLRTAFNSSIDQQQLLSDYTRKLERKVKWTQAGRFGWKAAAVAGGLFILKSVVN